MSTNANGSIRHNGAVSLLTAALLLVGTLAASTSAFASNTPTIQFGFGAVYDIGSTTSIGINFSDNQYNVVQVHQSPTSPTLMYSVGSVIGTGIYWQSSGINYDSGVTPACALNKQNVVVEVHQSQGDFSLWYNVGTLTNSALTWKQSQSFTTGVTPAVAVNDNNQVVEVHKSQSYPTLWYTVGTLAGTSINWGSDVNYEASGQSPAIAINHSGTVIEVHQSSSAATLWYRVGAISGNNINCDLQTTTPMASSLRLLSTLKAM